MTTAVTAVTHTGVGRGAAGRLRTGSTGLRAVRRSATAGNHAGRSPIAGGGGASDGDVVDILGQPHRSGDDREEPELAFALVEQRHAGVDVEEVAPLGDVLEVARPALTEGRQRGDDPADGAEVTEPGAARAE